MPRTKEYEGGSIRVVFTDEEARRLDDVLARPRNLAQKQNQKTPVIDRFIFDIGRYENG